MWFVQRTFSLARLGIVVHAQTCVLRGIVRPMSISNGLMETYIWGAATAYRVAEFVLAIFTELVL